MNQCKIHNIGFYKPEAKAIYIMALNLLENKLAISRADASIEIWNLAYKPFIEKTIISNLENFSIEGLVWAENNRLFSTGLHGFLVEYNLYSLVVKNKWSITGEAGTCIDYHSSYLAVGTELGYVNIFELTEDGTKFEKFLDKQEGRIVCLKYSKNGEFIIAGSINAIRVWNTKTGHAIHKMILGRSEAKKDTVVWCLEVLKDFTIFSGDSRGTLTLWDLKLGAQIESYHSHEADITAICVDENEEFIYAAGVDPLISNYQKVKVGGNFKWVRSIQRKIHNHDVRAMVLLKERLYSAGIDSYLICSYFPPKTMIKYAPILQTPCIDVSYERERRILLRYSKHLEIWSLSWPKTVADGQQKSFLLEPQERPKKLVVIQKIGKNWADEDEAQGINCANISPNGRWIFMGTSSGFNLYLLKLVKDVSKLTKIEDLDDNNKPCTTAIFSRKNQLIIATIEGNLKVYDLDNEDPFIVQTIEANKHVTDTISILAISNCGKFLSVADVKSNIIIFKYSNDGFEFYTKLPRYEAPPTAISFNKNSDQFLLVSFADNKLWEYDSKEKRLTNLSKNLENSTEWKPRTHVVRSITFDTKNNIFLHDDSNIIIIKRNFTLLNSSFSSSTKSKKIAKRISLVNGGDASDNLQITVIRRSNKHLIHLASLMGDEFIAVEVNPLFILEQLPPAFAQKTFGCK